MERIIKWTGPTLDRTHTGTCFRCGQQVSCVVDGRGRITNSWHDAIRVGDRPHPPIMVTWREAAS